MKRRRQHQKPKILATSAKVSSGGTGHSAAELMSKDQPAPPPVPVPGKRTEVGTVIGLTASVITLRVPSISAGYPGAGTQGTFDIDIHTPDDTVSTPSLSTLKVGSSATVTSYEADWHQVST